MGQLILQRGSGGGGGLTEPLNLTDTLSVALGAITTDKKVLNLSAEWNNAGITFKAIELAVTDSASAAASLLMDLKVGGASKFSVDKAGALTTTGRHVLPGGSAASPALTFTGATGYGLYYASGLVTFAVNGSDLALAVGSNSVVLSRDAGLAWSTIVGTQGGISVALVRDADNVLAQRNGTNAQALRVYNTYTSSTSYERLAIDWQASANLCKLGTEKGSGGGTARALAFMTDSVERMRLLADKPVLVFDEADADPGTGDLDDADSFALYRKGDKLVIAHNVGGTINYLTIPLDGSSTAWSQGTTAP